MKCSSNIGVSVFSQPQMLVYFELKVMDVMEETQMIRRFYEEKINDLEHGGEGEREDLDLFVTPVSSGCLEPQRAVRRRGETRGTRFGVVLRREHPLTAGETPDRHCS